MRKLNKALADQGKALQKELKEALYIASKMKNEVESSKGALYQKICYNGVIKLL